MAKRGAQSDLNHDNWADEEEAEEAGKFAQASEDELKKRVIKTARRRITGDSGGAAASGGAASSVFSGFKGFSAVTSTPAVKTVSDAPAGGAAAASPFSFLSGIAAKPSTNGTGSSAAATTSALGASIFASTDPSKKVFAGFGSPPKSVAIATATTTTAAKPTAAASATSEMKEGGSSKEAEYATSIKALNQSVATWISDKVKENPLCKLTPIFKDYEKYLDEIESKKSKLADVKEPVKTTPAPAVASSGFTFGNVATAPAATAAAPAKTFTFGSTSTSTSSSTPGTGFTFANVVPPSTEDKSDKADGGGDGAADEDEPPKVEFTPVEEKDSLYSKRCKLFVKVDGNFSDRGIGTVHIKKVESKVQVLVRADTNLGNILLNIILNQSVPVQRMGKNNVMMICLPTPDSKPPPTSVLLRVKTGEEADELFETLNKYKPK